MNTDPEPIAQPVTAQPISEPTLVQRLPVLTWVACAVCLVIFLGLSNERNPESWEAFSKWGCYPPDRIYGGAYWGFITSAFVHLEIWHLAFNLYWLYLFGSRFECAFGWAPWLAFVVSSAFVSSGAEFAFAGTTGHGASGVAYAFFGFLWVTRKHYRTFEAVLAPRTILLFVVWLFGCLAATLAKVWSVGNAAHIIGCLFGAGVGAWLLYRGWRRPLQIGLALMLLMAAVPPLWSPWSPNWTSHQALRAHKKGDFQKAVHWYQRSMQLGANKTWCWENLVLCYHSLGDQAQMKQALENLHLENERAASKLQAELGAIKSQQ